jgi:hypothetical protein
MVCVFLWTHSAGGGARTNEVLVARNRDALEAHLDTLLREEHPMAMRFEEAERYEFSVDLEEDPDFDYWFDGKGNEFIMQIFPNVPVSSDGRAWVACGWWGVRSDKYPGFISVTTDKRPETDGNSEVLFEVFILGTQLSKSASKT